MLSSIPGIENLSPAIKYVIAFAIIFALLALFALVLRRLTGGRLTLANSGGRARQPRLGIVDVYDLDRQRQLILLRRDNVEHLLLVGGPNDVVIETNIARAPGSRSLQLVTDTAADTGAERIPDAPQSRPVVEAPAGRPPGGTQPARRDTASGDAAAPSRPEPVQRTGATITTTARAPERPLRAAPAQPAPTTPPPRAVPRSSPPPANLPRTGSNPVGRPPEGNGRTGLSDMARQLEDALRRPAEPQTPPPRQSEAAKPAAPPRPPRPEPAPTGGGNDGRGRTDAPPPRPEPVPRPETAQRPDPAPAPQERSAPPAEPKPRGNPAPAPQPVPQPVPAPKGDTAPASSAPSNAGGRSDGPPAAAPAPKTARNPAPPPEPEPSPPPKAVEPPPPPPPAPEPPPPVPRSDPFSIEDIEAEFARLLGRPLDRKDGKG